MQSKFRFDRTADKQKKNHTQKWNEWKEEISEPHWEDEVKIEKN